VLDKVKQGWIICVEFLFQNVFLQIDVGSGCVEEIDRHNEKVAIEPFDIVVTSVENLQNVGVFKNVFDIFID
jgi:hypothetical protein